jgi:hypothetical protein
VILRSLTHPKPLIVHRKHALTSVVLNNHHASEILSSQPTIAEILWNFSRYMDDRRITLRQNPRFYFDLPTTYGAVFSKDPIQGDCSTLVRHNDTIYVLVDNPSQIRVFVPTDHGYRMFGNICMSNDILIFFTHLHNSLLGL